MRIDVCKERTNIPHVILSGAKDPAAKQRCASALEFFVLSKKCGM